MNLTDLIQSISEDHTPFTGTLDAVRRHTERLGTAVSGPEEFGELYKVAPWDVETLFSREVADTQDLIQILEQLNR